jgi:hypothetical protein
MKLQTVERRLAELIGTGVDSDNRKFGTDTRIVIEKTRITT